MNTSHSAAKVGEIFTAAGTAFTQLGELSMQLFTCSEQTNSISPQSAKTGVKRRSDTTTPVSKKNSSVNLKNIKQESSQQAALEATILAQQKHTSADLTLNMLNATETEVDVVGLTNSQKLQYEDSN